MDVEEMEARMSEQDTFSEQDWLQESVLENKYKQTDRCTGELIML